MYLLPLGFRPRFLHFVPSGFDSTDIANRMLRDGWKLLGVVQPKSSESTWIIHHPSYLMAWTREGADPIGYGENNGQTD